MKNPAWKRIVSNCFDTHINIPRKSGRDCEFLIFFQELSKWGLKNRFFSWNIAVSKGIEGNSLELYPIQFVHFLHIFAPKMARF
jgi:hypothetical protein